MKWIKPKIADKEKKYGYLWLVFIILFLVVVGLFAAAYYFYMKHGGAPAEKPVPFIDEQPPPQAEVEEKSQEQYQKQEPAKVYKAEPSAPIESEEKVEGPSPKDMPVGDYCPDGHPLVVSNDDEGYPAGYYMCAKCGQVYKCVTTRWTCRDCNIDYCKACKPIEGAEEPMVEMAGRKPSGSKGFPEFKGHYEAKSEEGESKMSEEGKSSGGATPAAKGVLGAALQKAALVSIKKIVESKQTEQVAEYRKVEPTGKVTWSKTHFIFAIDCSGSMKGERWKSVKSGFTAFLQKVKRMKEVLISAFTFDDMPNPFCREKTPQQAFATAKNMPFSGKGTNYKRALEHVINIINVSQHQDYLPCIVFLSDGLGGFPIETVEKLEEIKEQGRKILFYTIACETDQDADMLQMATALEGEHFKVMNTEAAKMVFATILGV